jgi:hypothetical protein
MQIRQIRLEFVYILNISVNYKIKYLIEKEK